MARAHVRVRSFLFFVFFRKWDTFFVVYGEEPIKIE